MDHKLLLDALENPDVLQSESGLSRRDAFRSGGKLGAGLALASMPVLMATLTRKVFAQGGGLPTPAVDVFNFALLLEYLEAEFYNRGLAASGLITAEARPVFLQIAKHENAHVAFLKAVLGSKAIPEPVFNFQVFGLTPFSNYDHFLLLSQAFEDTGVRAYKGQAPALYELNEPRNPTAALLLTSALRIHSVEARHAAEVRRLRGLESWIPFNQPDAPAAVQAVYAGEQNTVHAGVDVLTLETMQRFLNDSDPLSGITAEQVTEAFDEPLSAQAVFAIINPFGTGRTK